MRFTVIAVAAASLLGAAGCGGSDAPAREKPSAERSVVAIKTFQFTPDPLEVKAGTTVRWDNADGTTHTVTAGTRRRPRRAEFDGSMAQDESFSHTFAEPGTYAYFCALHNGPGMTAKVVVRP